MLWKVKVLFMCQKFGLIKTRELAAEGMTYFTRAYALSQFD